MKSSTYLTEKLVDIGSIGDITAVILAAGEGKRLSPLLRNTPKPTLFLLGLSLGERIVTTCMKAGIHKFVIVTGYKKNQVRTHFEGVSKRRGCRVEFVWAENWKYGNGTSALAAQESVLNSPFLLVMSDHLVDTSLLQAILKMPPKKGEICLAVDRSKDPLGDLEDVTKVRLRGDRVVGIGKELSEWDGSDTGVFFCTHALFEGIKRAEAKGRNNLTDGVLELAEQGRVRSVEVTGTYWLDVDTKEDYRLAKSHLLSFITKGSEDGYISQWINRPLSARLSSLLAGTGVTPNQISLVSFVISLVGALLFCLGQFWAGVLAGTLIQISSVIDGCDGEIARLKQLSSPRGAWMDTILDRFSDMALVVTVTIGFAVHHPGPLPWVLALITAVGFLLASYITKEFALRFQRPYPNTLLNRLKRRDLRLFGVFLGSLAGHPFVVLVGLGLISHACVVGIFLKELFLTSHPTSSYK